MSWNGRPPSAHNRHTWTAYERARDGVGFDHDGRSARHAGHVYHGVEDVEDLTLLAGLTDE